MRKYSIISFALLFIIIIACNSNNKNKPQLTLTTVKELNDYPSASGIEFLDGKVYIIGDDANNLLVLDTGLNVIDSIRLYDFPDKRIPKTMKADLEAITVFPDGKLLLTGSGSLAPYRNIAWLINPVTKRKDSIRLDTFYQRLLSYNIAELNIEGITAMRNSPILANRGNKNYRRNQLIFTDSYFWDQQSTIKINTSLVGFNADSNSFSGVSGLAYAAKSDALILTVSTEDTRNSLDDGAIGKSYLWIVKTISSKRRWKAINPDKVIDLEEIDQRFKGHKIESACILKETRHSLYLLLAADNDNGSSTLFKLIVPKE